MPAIKDRIAQLREENGWSKTNVAKRLGVGLSTYANWEYGYSEPDVETINRLASLYEVSNDYIMGKSNTRSLDPNSTISSDDLDDMLDNAHSYDGKPMDEHDRELIKSYLKGYFQGRYKD